MNDYNNIYWREIGMAPAHLTIKEDINLTKYMSGWSSTLANKKGYSARYSATRYLPILL